MRAAKPPEELKFFGSAKAAGAAGGFFASRRGLRVIGHPVNNGCQALARRKKRAHFRE